MDLLSSADTVEFLSKSAPAPWVKRMLLWMICQGEIAAYFRSGLSVARAPAFAAVKDARGELPTGEEREEIIKRDFPPELAEKLLHADGHDYIEEIACEWSTDDEPRQVAQGYFLYMESLNWESGRLVGIFMPNSGYDYDLLQDRNDILNSNIQNAEYTVSFDGLCFNKEAIEMLQPAERLLSNQSSPDTGRRSIGRPRLWDWDAATMHLITIAQTPDGLPVGPGAQAAIERAITEWFMSKSGNSPAPSQIRQHASKVMRTLKTPESL